MKGVRSKRYPRGQIILYKDDPAYEVVILKKGIIKLHDVDAQGNEKILHLVKPYAVAPLAFFSGNNENMHWFYSALTDCEVCTMPAEELTRMMRENSELALYLVNWFSLEVHELLVRLGSFGKTNARDKVTAALKFLAARHALGRRSGWRSVAFPVNQQFIADMTGLTRESAAAIMRDLLGRGLIRTPRQTLLEVNLPALSKAAAPET